MNVLIKAVVDRFEGMAAVLLVGESETQVCWPRDMLPEDCGEGDVLRVSLQKDPEATRAAFAEAADLMKELLGK